MRVEGVPPARPRMPVADPREPDRIALVRERGRERLVVGAVLLGRAAGQRDRDGAVAAGAAQHRTDEARDPAIPGKARLLLVEALAEEAAGLEQQAVQRLRVPEM